MVERRRGEEREREKDPLSYDSVGKSLQWQPMTDNLLKRVKERVEEAATQQLSSEEYYRSGFFCQILLV